MLTFDRTRTDYALPPDWMARHSSCVGGSLTCALLVSRADYGTAHSQRLVRRRHSRRDSHSRLHRLGLLRQWCVAASDVSLVTSPAGTDRCFSLCPCPSFCASLAKPTARYAGPIKTTTRWTIGAEVDLPRTGSASRSKATNKKATATPAPPAPAPTTSSAAHGRSAHVFSSFPTLMTHDGPPHSGDEGEGESGASEWTEASRSSWDEGTGTGTGWTGASLSAGGTTTSGATATPGQSRVGRAREGGEEEQGARGRERSAQR